MEGIGVMLGMLGGNKETVNAVKGSLGKTIMSARVIDDELKILLEDETTLVLWDGGQSCCEHRYMHTDDNPNDYVGAKLLDIELSNVEYKDAEYDEHEVQFLRVKTSEGIFVISNHNEHNGYYGGFWIQAKIL